MFKRKKDTRFTQEPDWLPPGPPPIKWAGEQLGDNAAPHRPSSDPSHQFLIDMAFPSVDHITAIYDGLCQSMQHVPKNSKEYELCRRYGAEVERWGQIQMELMASAVALIEVINVLQTSQWTNELLHWVQQTVSTETQKINAISEESIQMRMAAGAFDAEIMVANIALKFLRELGAKLEPAMLD